MKEGNLRKIYFLITSLFLFGGVIITFFNFLDRFVSREFFSESLHQGLYSYELRQLFFFVLPFLLLFLVHFGIFRKMTKGEK